MDTYTGYLDVKEESVTCWGSTPHFDNGCKLAIAVDGAFDGVKDGVISLKDISAGTTMYNLTEAERTFLKQILADHGGVINAECSNCYTPVCECTSWVNAECTVIGKRRQTRTCTPAGCDTEERIIDDAGCKPSGDITKVTLDDKLLPEGGTLPWLLNDDAHVKVFFKNTGNLANAFHIWLTDDTDVPIGGAGPVITGCDITTAEIPADGAEYFVDLCVFLPDIVKVKTLTANIDP